MTHGAHSIPWTSLQKSGSRPMRSVLNTAYSSVMRECPHCGAKPLIVMTGTCADCRKPIVTPRTTGRDHLGFAAGWSHMQTLMDNPPPEPHPTRPRRSRSPSRFRVAFSDGWSRVKSEVDDYRRERQHARRESKASSPPAREPLQEMTWQQAEVYVCAWMMQHGFPDAMMTAAGPDSGVDVMAAHAVAQVKNHARPVGIAEVQRLQGIAGSLHRQALLFASNGMTTQALRWADEHGVACYSYPPVTRLQAAR
jgi:hypothetical protein